MMLERGSQGRCRGVPGAAAACQPVWISEIQSWSAPILTSGRSSPPTQASTESGLKSRRPSQRRQRGFPPHTSLQAAPLKQLLQRASGHCTSMDARPIVLSAEGIPPPLKGSTLAAVPGPNPGRLFVCDECGITFSKKSALAEHVVSRSPSQRAQP